MRVAAEISPPSTVLSPPFIEFKDRVAQDQQQHEIEGRELAGLAFPVIRRMRMRNT
jgi:hypothetical protein